MYLYFKILFIFDCTGSSLLQRLFSPLSLCKRGLLSSCCEWASPWGGFSCCRAQALELAGFSHCGTGAQQLWLPGSRAQAQELWHMGLVASERVGSSRIKDQTHFSCIGRRTLYHWAIREATKYHYYHRCPRVYRFLIICFLNIWWQVSRKLGQFCCFAFPVSFSEQ